MRGVGGVFFDDLTPTGEDAWERAFAFVDDGVATLERAYLPVVARRKEASWSEAEREWQLHRRSRYAEFNLLYDRGTRFGLETEGNVEAILMSMPPKACWDFNPDVPPGSPEAETLEMLQPREWA
jgi:coproporphyrinogen III oxidase